MNICMDNSKEVELWITAVTEFHRCEVEETDRENQKKAAQAAIEEGGVNSSTETSSSSNTVVRMRQENRSIRDNLYTQSNNELKDIVRNQEEKRMNFLKSIQTKYDQKLQETEEMLKTQQEL